MRTAKQYRESARKAVQAMRERRTNAGLVFVGVWVLPEDRKRIKALEAIRLEERDPKVAP